MTYHTSSDVPVPYGRVVPRLKQEEEEEKDHDKEEPLTTLTALTTSTTLTPLKTLIMPRFEGEGEGKGKKEKPLDYHAEKKKGVALLASNCAGDSGRYNYLDK